MVEEWQAPKQRWDNKFLKLSKYGRSRAKYGIGISMGIVHRGTSLQIAHKYSGYN